MAIRSRAITSSSAAASARTRRSAANIYRDVKAEDAPRTIERMLKGYLAHRAGADETFLTFTRRHEVEALKAMFDAEAAE